ncbi:MAG: lamin tail domain-containing protein [Angustibacter sp.]
MSLRTALTSRLSRPALHRTLAATMGTALLATVLSASVGAAPASATSSVTGYVVAVWDGDTFDVDIYGDGTSTPKRVRIAGIQAMELSTYSRDLTAVTGQCWGGEAARGLGALILHKQVRLTSRYASSTSRGRLLRNVDVLSGGSYLDVGARMLANGVAIPDVNKVEYLRNRSYMGIALWAASHRRGMYGYPTHCGSGPYQANRLGVTVNWKGGAAVNGEWIRITNYGTTSVHLGGWWVRDNALRRYTFPSWAWVRPGASVYVHPGKGTSTSTHFYWGLSSAIFEDATAYPTYLGDGGYLFDPQGDLRGWQQYRL